MRWWRKAGARGAGRRRRRVPSRRCRPGASRETLACSRAAVPTSSQAPSDTGSQRYSSSVIGPTLVSVPSPLSMAGPVIRSARRLWRSRTAPATETGGTVSSSENRLTGRIARWRTTSSHLIQQPANGSRRASVDHLRDIPWLRVRSPPDVGGKGDADVRVGRGIGVEDRYRPRRSSQGPGNRVGIEPVRIVVVPPGRARSPTGTTRRWRTSATLPGRPSGRRLRPSAHHAGFPARPAHHR